MQEAEKERRMGPRHGMEGEEVVHGVGQDPWRRFS